MKNLSLSCALVALILVPNEVQALARGAEQDTSARQPATSSPSEGGARAERREQEGRRGREGRRGPRRRGPLQRLPAEQRQAALELLQSARQAAAPLREELRGLRDEARRRVEDLGPGADLAAREALRAELRARAIEARRRHAPAVADHGRQLVGLLPEEARARLMAASKARAEKQGVAWSEALLHERAGLRLALRGKHAGHGHRLGEASR